MKQLECGYVLDGLAREAVVGGEEKAGAAGKPAHVYNWGFLQRKLDGVRKALDLSWDRCVGSRNWHAGGVGSNQACSLAWRKLAQARDMTDCVSREALKCDTV